MQRKENHSAPARYADGEFVWFVPDYSVTYHRVQIIRVEGRSYLIQTRPEMPPVIQQHCERKISFAKAKTCLFTDERRALAERQREERTWTHKAHRELHSLLEDADFATTCRIAEILGYPALATPEQPK